MYLFNSEFELCEINKEGNLDGNPFIFFSKYFDFIHA